MVDSLSCDLLESLYGPFDDEANRASVIELSHSSAEMYATLKHLPFVAQHHACHALGEALVGLFMERIASFSPRRTKLERTGTTLFRLLVDGAYIVHGANNGDHVLADVYGFRLGRRTMFNPADFRECRSRLEVFPDVAGGIVRLHEERLHEGRFQLIPVNTVRYDALHDGLVAAGFY